MTLHILHYHFIEPSEDQLALRVEYDMDEQDKIWLDAHNTRRKRENEKLSVPDGVFELVMDRLEKAWFELVRGRGGVVVFCEEDFLSERFLYPLI